MNPHPIRKPILAAAILSLLTLSPISAQEIGKPQAEPRSAPAAGVPDPFRKPAALSGTPVATVPPPLPNAVEATDEVPPQVSIIVEYIQVSLAEASRIVRAHAGKRDVSEMRKELDSLIADGSAVLVETGYLVTRSGQRTKSESIEERIYPTEIDPGKIPTTLSIETEALGAEAGVALKTPPQPTAFEMRPVGFTIEVDPIIATDGRGLDVNVAPEIVEYHAGESTTVPEGSPYKELMGVTMPIFYSMKLQTAVSLSDGETILLGVQTPRVEKDQRILVLLRADIVK